MSAIAGIFYLDGRKAERETLLEMMSPLSFMGKDANAAWVKDSVALSHQMSWTTQESLSEKLPFEDSVSNLVITADARIDNRAELAKKLDLAATQLKSLSDSELILYAYRKWGRDCTCHLLGDFSFVIWDTSRRELFCARDHSGCRPFFIFIFPEKFLPLLLP